MYLLPTMSSSATGLVAHEPVGDVTPIRLDAGSLDSTAPEYLRDLQARLADDGLAPVELHVEARFEEECPIETQTEADRVRGLVRAAAFVGANRVTVSIEDETVTEAAQTALAACAERASREGLGFEVEEPIALEH